MTRLVYIFLFLAVLTGCSPSPEKSVLDDYLKRISRVTEISFSSQNIESSPRLPPLRQRQYTIEDSYIKALTALDLLQCPGLSQKVAFRNSPLGKQLQPSQRLHYEKELLLEIHACIDYLQGENRDPQTVILLKEISVVKTKQLPAVRWNMLFGKVELTEQLQVARYPLPYKSKGKDGTLNAFIYIEGYLQDSSTEPPFNRQELELHLQQLTASDYSGELIRSAVQLSYTLNEIAQMLETRMAETPVCEAGQPSVTAERLHNVFNLLYLGKVQPYLSWLNQEAGEWRQAFRNLLVLLPASPSDEISQYLARISSEPDEQGIWQDLQSAIFRHVKAWKAVFEQCRWQ